MNSRLFPLAVALTLCSSAHAQVSESFGNVAIEDGHITFAGTFKQLSGIEVISEGGFLSVADLEIAPGVFIASREPFKLGDGILVANTPHHVVIGVLGVDNRIDLEGRTRTSILFSSEGRPTCNEPIVNVGLGDDRPVKIQYGLCPEPSATSLVTLGFLGLVCLRKPRICDNTGFHSDSLETR